MPPAPPAPTETARLAALHTYAVLDTAADETVQEIVHLAAHLAGSPIALVSLVDQDRQWFLAREGLAVRETPRDQAFCAYAILDAEHPLAVPDTTQDARFLDNPLVTGEMGFRAYLGVPLVNTEGFALGTLCVIDRVPRHHDADTVRMLQVLARAVTSNLELRRALRHSDEMAHTDPLTGLPNRRALTAQLAAALGSGQPLAAILLDLDHMKEVNDAEGHAAGDALLCTAATRLRAAVRPCDIVARTGGDEFAAILVGVEAAGLARSIAHRISTALHAPVPYGERSLRLGATLGMAMAPTVATDAEVLLRAADAALGRAKRDGRGSIGWSSREDAARLLHASAVIRTFDAATSGSIVAGTQAHLQPIVALRPHAAGAPPVLAMEALARWSDPQTGPVPPAELLDIIGPERIVVLGSAVRVRALEAVATLRRQGLSIGRLALNLSAVEVARDDIAAMIVRQVADAGLSLRDVEVEITEEVLLDRVSDHTLRQLAALRGQGARLVLDDFGTGNSGLSQLLRLPLDAVKLDKRFVQGLGVDSRAEEIVRATVSLAHGMGLEVVAEGVETVAQARMLMDIGCDAAQGFLYARPMPPHEVPAWLARKSPSAQVVPLRSAKPKR
jgi:diguanylate cyclase